MSAERPAFEGEPIAVGDDVKNQINNRWPRSLFLLE